MIKGREGNLTKDSHTTRSGRPFYAYPPSNLLLNNKTWPKREEEVEVEGGDRTIM